jgi:hypothetical protein
VKSAVQLPLAIVLAECEQAQGYLGAQFDKIDRSCSTVIHLSGVISHISELKLPEEEKAAFSRETSASTPIKASPRPVIPGVVVFIDYL